MARLKAVVFDIDGTLYPNYRMYFRSIPFFLRNIHLIREFNEVRKDIRNERPITDFYGRQAELLAERLSIDIEKSRSIIDGKIYAEWSSSVFKAIQPFAHVKSTLSALRSEGYLLGALSDFPVEDKLVMLGLDSCWDYSVSSETVGYLKPAPESFIHTARQLKVDPSEVLYVGNNYTYDVLGAVNAGMHAAHISSRAPAGSKAAFTFSHYGDFLDKLEALQKRLA